MEKRKKEVQPQLKETPTMSKRRLVCFSFLVLAAVLHFAALV